MARTRRADYQRSNRIRTLPLHDPEAAALATQRLLRALDAPGRLRLGAELLAVLSAQAGIGAPELVVPDEHQPHRRSGGRIVYSLQGDYRRRSPSPGCSTRTRYASTTSGICRTRPALFRSLSSVTAATSSSTPVPVAGGLRFVSLSAGNGFT